MKKASCEEFCFSNITYCTDIASYIIRCARRSKRSFNLYFGKVKLSHYTTSWHLGGGEGIAPSRSSFTSAVDGGELSASRSGRALPPVPIG
jgi:hypothetical protein